MTKHSQFNNGHMFLFFNLPMPLTYKKPNIYSQIFQNLWASTSRLKGSCSFLSLP